MNTVHSFHLRRTVAPKFQAQPQDFEGIEGQVAMFRCVADGNPKPLYRWFDNSRNLIDSRKSKYGISPSGEYLTIYELVEADAGEFSCEASNQAGKTKGGARLSVIVPPGLNEGQTETREQGQEVTFVCHVMRGEGQLSWWRNGKHVEEGSEVKIQNFSFEAIRFLFQSNHHGHDLFSGSEGL